MEVQKLFLETLRVALHGEKVTWDGVASAEDLRGILSMAQDAQVLPLVYDAISCCHDIQRLEKDYVNQIRQKVHFSVSRQATRTMELLRLYPELEKTGASPILLKGLVCRLIYPKPDLRTSNDEDILTDPRFFHSCESALFQNGYHLLYPDVAQENEQEVSYICPEKGMLIELHKTPFGQDNDLDRTINYILSNAVHDGIQITVSGATISSMNWTHHLFFLICHAMKHFRGPGVGIRQICDVCMMANKHAEHVDWETLTRWLAETGLTVFAGAVFSVGERYLGLKMNAGACSSSWNSVMEKIDVDPLILDAISGGLYGTVSKTRKTSGVMTWRAVEQRSANRKQSSIKSLVFALFPPKDFLIFRYPYLQKRPYLLPIAWIQRISTYHREATRNHTEMLEAMRIGQRRIGLMKYYGLLSD